MAGICPLLEETKMLGDYALCITDENGVSEKIVDCVGKQTVVIEAYQFICKKYRAKLSFMFFRVSNCFFEQKI